MKRSISAIEKKVSNFHGILNNVQKDINDLKTFVIESRSFKENEKIVTLDNLAELYNIQFLIKTVDEFTTFDNAIVDSFYQDLVSCVV